MTSLVNKQLVHVAQKISSEGSIPAGQGGGCPVLPAAQFWGSVRPHS